MVFAWEKQKTYESVRAVTVCHSVFNSDRDVCKYPKAGILSVWDSGLFHGTGLWGILCMKWRLRILQGADRRTYSQCGGIVTYMMWMGTAEVWRRERCASKLSLRIQRDTFKSWGIVHRAHGSPHNPAPLHPICILLLWLSKSLFMEHDGRGKTYARLIPKRKKNSIF